MLLEEGLVLMALIEGGNIAGMYDAIGRERFLVAWRVAQISPSRPLYLIVKTNPSVVHGNEALVTYEAVDVYAKRYQPGMFRVVSSQRMAPPCGWWRAGGTYFVWHIRGALLAFETVVSEPDDSVPELRALVS
jgi:hypothetical protein